MSFTAIITANINEFQRNLGRARGDMNRFENSVKGSVNNVDNQFSNFTRKFGGLIAGAFAVERVASFTAEITRLGGEMQGVGDAYYRFADAKQMQELQRATAGTVSELELMKRAVMARQFGIPIENLGNLLEFATKRAQETGQSVDYLVNSIVTGIGRKSPLILDNLGISAVELREKLKGVGYETASVADYAAAVGEIAAESMAESGAILEDSGIKAQRAAASWENLKITWGLLIAESEGLSSVLDGINRQLELMQEDTSRWAQIFRVVFGDPTKSINQRYFEDLIRITENTILASNAEEKSTESKQKLVEVTEDHAETVGDLRQKVKELKGDIDSLATTETARIQQILAEIDATEKLINTLTTLQVVRRPVDPGTTISTRGETPQIGFPIPPQELEFEKLDRWKDGVMEHYRSIMAEMQEEIDYLNQSVNLALADGFAGGLEAAFNGQKIEGILSAFLQPIANFLQQEGAMLIAHGLAIEVFKKSLQSLNGIAAIAAGTAMVATAAAFKSIVSTGSRRFGGGSSGSYSGAANHSYAYQDAPTGIYDDQEIKFRISGSDLLASIKAQELKNNRL